MPFFKYNLFHFFCYFLGPLSKLHNRSFQMTDPGYRVHIYSIQLSDQSRLSRTVIFVCVQAFEFSNSLSLTNWLNTKSFIYERDFLSKWKF